jgi:hypothetical protein
MSLHRAFSHGWLQPRGFISGTARDEKNALHFAEDLQQVAEALRERRAILDRLALDAIKLRAASRARPSIALRQKGFFMRSPLTTALAIAFLCLGTSGAVAMVGGVDFGLGGNHGSSASFNQYRPGGGPPPVVPPVQVPPPQASNPPGTGPPASKFIPRPPSATLSPHGVATVRCSTACHIVLRARRGSHLVRVRVTLRASGSTKIRLTKSELKRLGRGRVAFSVEVDGKRVTGGTLRVA